jgi:NodT family efflux transporter outer membrane factor (OMF) lipoprotein
MNAYQVNAKRIEQSGWLLLILMGLLIWSCATPSQLATPEKIDVPQNYQFAAGDSLAKAELPKWNVYFKDSLLVALIDTAIKNNPDMRIAEQRLYAAGAQFRSARQTLAPTINAAVSTGVTRFGDYTIDGVGNFDTNLSPNISDEQRIPNPVPDYFIGAAMTWETGLFGKLRNRKRAAYYRLIASREGKHLIQTQVVAQVAHLYYELLARDMELEIIRKTVAVQTQALEIINIQKQSGRINELAVKQFKAQLYDFQSHESIKVQEIIAVENALNELLGRYPQPIVRKDTLVLTDLPEMLQTGVPVSLLQNRPDVKQTEREWMASTAELKSAKAALYPNIVIDARMGYNGFNAPLLFDPASFAYMIAGGMLMPVLNRNTLVAQHRVAFAQKNQSFYEYRKSMLKAVQEVQTELNKVQNYRTVSNYKTQEVLALREAVSISNELFYTGFATYIEVLLARQNRLRAELELADTYKEQFKASVQLYKALGGGWE